ncbi:unnamed protein product [Polarella glacialis]|uniref:Uncharacterized protein n=1 Tax=Polarella glacialis TaxID=89957 RepID=A0A813JYJ8_POLGL|nr:unnamed protein product [Polarella glacialis]
MEVSNEQWRFMRECLRDNIQAVHSVKKELQELQVVSQEDLSGVAGTMDARLDKLEKRFQQELKREQTGRDADVHELRELVGGESMAREGHFGAMRELLTKERQAREAHAGSVQELFARERELTETHIQEIKGSLHEVRGLFSAESTARERRQSDMQSSVEGKLKALQSTLRAEISAQRDRVEQQLGQLQEQFFNLDKREEQDARREQHSREAAITELREQLQVERIARQDAGEHLGKLLAKDAATLQTHELALTELHDAIGGERLALQDHLSCVKELLGCS